mgnify:CR=1 FL=1
MARAERLSVSPTAAVAIQRVILDSDVRGSVNIASGKPVAVRDVEKVRRALQPVWREIHGTNGGAVPSEPRMLAGVKVGRNDPCPCGSGKKYKKCCLLKGA